MIGAPGEQVTGDAQGGVRGIDVGPAGDVLLEKIVLDGSGDLRRIHPLFAGDRDVKRQQDRRGGVDRHGRRHAIQRDPVQ